MTILSVGTRRKKKGRHPGGQRPFSSMKTDQNLNATEAL